MNRTFVKDTDMLQCLRVRSKTLYAMEYLHGLCQLFALALNKIFGYKIILWTEQDPELGSTALVHAFNYIEVDDKVYYADIRGITDKIEDIIDGFDYWEEPELIPLEYNSLISILNDLGIDCSIPDEVNDIIENYRDNYIIRSC